VAQRKQQAAFFASNLFNHGVPAMADQFNPYTAPQSTTSPPAVEEGGGLKSLGQEARKSSLNKARWILIIVGLLQLGYSIWEFTNLDAALKGELQRRNIRLDAQQFAEVKASVMPFVVGFLCAGVVFILLGVFIHQYPVPFSIAGLVLYLAIQLFNVVTSDNPGQQLASGLLMKILFIGLLWSAIQAARAYEQERRLSPYDGF
jgi:uncharacterized membrane protein YidH (DUF202 family)